MQGQNREIPIAVIHIIRNFVLSFRHGGKRVVSLPRETDDKSADVEAFTQLAAASLM